MHIGCFTRVIPCDSPATTQNSLWQSHCVTEHHVPDIIQHMHSPIPHLTRPGVPVPVPVVLQIVPKNRLVRCRPQPEIIVDGFRNRQRLSAFANRPANPITIHPHRLQCPQRLFFVQKRLQLGLHRIRALLRSNLTDAIVQPRGCHRLVTFPLTVRQRLLDIHILARLHRLDCRQTVPVVAGGDDHSVHIRRFNQPPQILRPHGLRKSLLRLAQT